MSDDIAALRELLRRREQARKDGLPGRVLGYDLDLALAAPALLDRIEALEEAINAAFEKVQVGDSDAAEDILSAALAGASR